MPSGKSATLGVFAATTGILVISNSYVDALFLSSYPRNWLPFFFAAQGVLVAATAFLLAPILARNPARNSLYLQSGAALAILVFVNLLRLKWRLTPLFFSFFLMTQGLIFGITSWNSVRSAFDIVEFKRLTNAISVTSSAASIAASLLVWALAREFSIAVLPYAVVGLILLSCYCTWRLQPITGSVEREKNNNFPLRYPLFRQLAANVFLLAASLVLIDYCLKSKLGGAYDAQGIGEFMGAFTGISNVLAILFGFYALKPILNRYGAAGAMAALPAYCALASGIVFFFPTLWGAALLSAGKYMLYYTSFVAGREILFSALPPQVRLAGQFQAKAVAGSAGTCLAALALFVVGKQASLPAIAVAIFSLNAWMVFSMLRMRGAYVATLREEVRLQRFNLSGEISQRYPEAAKEVLSHALSSQDINLTRFGFSLLSQVRLPEILPQALRHINSEQPDVRVQAIRLASEYHAAEAVPELLARLETETDPEIRWWLLDSLAILRPESALEKARGYRHDPAAEVRAGAIRVLLAAGGVEDLRDALDSLQAMLRLPDPAARKAAARILSTLPIGHLKNELARLIADADHAVSSQAIAAAAQLELGELLPDILHRLGEGGVFHSAHKAIASFGSQALPLLLQDIEERKNVNAEIPLRVLAAIPGEKAESCLSRLAGHPDTLIRNATAKESAYRARRFALTPNFRRRAKEFALHEAALLRALELAGEGRATPALAQEFAARAYMAQKRFLYWLGAHGRAKELLGLMPTLLGGRRGEKATAIELLHSSTDDKELPDVAAELFLGRSTSRPPRGAPAPLEDCLDSWLRKVIKMEQEPEAIGVPQNMHNMQKVFALRSVELFKHLPGETLLVIAEEAQAQDMCAGQTIFSEGDPPTGLYVVVSGEVDVVKKGSVIAKLKEHDFFGEVALVDNNPRSASAVAKTEGMLLFIDKETFDRITDDLPEVLKAVVQTVVRYLRQG